MGRSRPKKLWVECVFNIHKFLSIRPGYSSGSADTTNAGRMPYILGIFRRFRNWNPQGYDDDDDEVYDVIERYLCIGSDAAPFRRTVGLPGYPNCTPFAL